MNWIWQWVSTINYLKFEKQPQFEYNDAKSENEIKALMYNILHSMYQNWKKLKTDVQKFYKLFNQQQFVKKKISITSTVLQ